MRQTDEWIGATDDTSVPPRVRLRVYEKFNGRCPKCTRKLQPGQWDCDHVIALANGGENRESNLQPLCDNPCHSQKTKSDVADKSKSYRKRRSHAGIKKPRTITRWRRFDGSIVQSSRSR